MVEPTDTELEELFEKLRGSLNASQSLGMTAALVELEEKRSGGLIDARGTLKAAVMCAWLLRKRPIVH